MIKFAHFADVHLGFQKLPSLQNLERKAIGGVIGGAFPGRRISCRPASGRFFLSRRRAHHP